MQEQFQRLAALYGDVIIIHGGEPLRYGMYIHDWCKNTDGFTEIVEPKSVRTYGAGPAGMEQAERLMAQEPDEVWKFRNSPGSRRNPDHAIYPEFWALAGSKGIPLRVFSYQNRKTPYKSYLEEPKLDQNGFPVPVKLRKWDAERNGILVNGKHVQSYSKTKVGKRQLRERRQGNYRAG